jgi:hypothetical protein
MNVNLNKFVFFLIFIFVYSQMSEYFRWKSHQDNLFPHIEAMPVSFVLQLDGNGAPEGPRKVRFLLNTLIQ